MERDRLSHLAHAEHPLSAPVDEGRARRLLGRLAIPPGGSVVDLGCGQGAWLLLLAAERSDLRLLGVDTSAAAIAGARTASARSGYPSSINWLHSDAATASVGTHDAVICVGASHAFGGLDGTLKAVRERMKPGGRVILGDTIWEHPPSQAAQDSVEAGADDFPDLAGLVSRALEHRFEVIDGHVSTLEEWDDYEWAWTGTLLRWALQQPDGSDRAAALEAAREHRDAWLGGYRRYLGFATLALVDLPDL
jgi:cyclopropane fatty-acyl-phospholipid synthase-like methyltransferase